MTTGASSFPLKYEGIAYRQAIDPSSPWLITFVACAEELSRWAGVPHRSDENVTGFQRLEDPIRVQKAKEFFDIAQNQSPTAIVLGFHATPGGTEPGLSVTIEPGENSIRRCVVTVHRDVSVMSLEQLATVVKAQVQSRLDADSPESDEPSGETEALETDLENSDENVPGGGDPLSDATPHQEEPVADEEIELGRSLLQHLRTHLGDMTWCKDNADALRDIAKPATVIDGQHRLRGAEACERAIPFTVCALVDCSWPEQVFQFTVVNYTARGIPDQFITANAALSLTREELATLRTRLVQAKVKVIEYELMRVIHFDEQSPFFNLVNLTEKKDSSRIGYKTMVKIAKVWYQGRHDALKLLIPALYPDAKGIKGTSERMRRWKDGDWGLFFQDFWNVIKDIYSPHTDPDTGSSLWTVGQSNLMIAIVLLEIQEQFLVNLGGQDEEYFQPKEPGNAINELRQKIRERAKKFAGYLPHEFFEAKWGLGTGLNIGPGRKALQEVLQNLVNKKGKYQYEKSALLTGKIEKS